jgi:hypothetical protein
VTSRASPATRPALRGAVLAPFGADGQGAATPRSYALSTPGGSSGLVDTATTGGGLSLSSGVVEGRTRRATTWCSPSGGRRAATSSSTRKRAVAHPDTANHDDSVTLSAANLWC